MHILGPFPKATRRRQFVLVVVDSSLSGWKLKHWQTSQLIRWSLSCGRMWYTDSEYLGYWSLIMEPSLTTRR
jgi:hypothetical protein